MPPAEEPSEKAGTLERLDDRILRTIESTSGRLSFNGLRRALAVHPESLSRALRRLERIGIVLRDAGGYALADPAHSDVDGAALPSLRPVGEVLLPAGASDETVLGLFAGRWLQELRWVGIQDAGRGTVLIWSVPGVPGQVLLTVRDGRLIVGTDRSPSPESAPLEEAARRLLITGLRRLPGLPERPSPPGSVGLRPENRLLHRFGPN